MGSDAENKHMENGELATEAKQHDSQTKQEDNTTAKESDPAAAVNEKELGASAEKETAVSQATSKEDEASSTSKQDVQPSTEKAVTENGEDEHGEHGVEAHYVSGLPRLILVFGLCVTTFLVGLDQMIIATAIPKITTLFHSLEDVGWYGSAYLLCTTSLQPSFGKIYTYFDIKYTFVAALVVFEVGSIICAAATSSPMLIVGRAIAGSGGAGLFSGGMTMLGFAIPLNQRTIYLAFLSSMFGIASIVGPIMGGAFTDRLTWRWCFWINLPFGGVAIVTVLFFFKSPKRDFSNKTLKEKIHEMDLPGAVFLIAAITCLLLALQWGGTFYPWNDSKVWGCILGFGLLIAIFIGLQVRGGESATIPLHIMKQRTITAVALVLAFLSMGIYTHVYYLPFYFQAVKGTTAEQSGIRCIAYLISNTLGSIIVGGIVTAVGYYTPFIIGGTAVFTVGSGLIYTLQVNSSSGRWIGYQILAGFGSGCSIQLPFIATQVVLSPKDMPTGNSIAIFFNSLGGAIAISIAQNIFSNTLVEELPKVGLGDMSEMIVHAGAQGFRGVVPAQSLGEALEAYNTAITTAFILPIAVGGLGFLCSFLFEWRSVKGVNLMGGGGAA